MVWLTRNKLPGAGGDINIITKTGMGASASSVFCFNQEKFIIFIGFISS
jgi:hypothetical protein